MIERLGSACWRWAASSSPWTNAYGLSRTLLAVSPALTLLLSHSSALFCPGTGRPVAVNGKGPAIISFFWFLRDHLELARGLSVLFLVVVAIGWRPRWTALVHWWIVWSFQVSATMVDGGDQVTAVLALLLLPVALTDPRHWHWEPAPSDHIEKTSAVVARLVALSALFMIRLQMAGIYFHAAIGKAHAEQWMDGSAVYYWFSDASFGAPSWLMWFIGPLIRSAPTVALISWGTILLELSLAAALVMPKRAWKPLLLIACTFHVGIAIIHGLISFSGAMVAGLLLYLRPVGEPFRRLEMRQGLRTYLLMPVRPVKEIDAIL